MQNNLLSNWNGYSYLCNQNYYQTETVILSYAILLWKKANYQILLINH